MAPEFRGVNQTTEVAPEFRGVGRNGSRYELVTAAFTPSPPKNSHAICDSKGLLDGGAFAECLRDGPVQAQSVAPRVGVSETGEWLAAHHSAREQ